MGRSSGVREPGSTLPILVGCFVFSAKPKKNETPHCKAHAAACVLPVCKQSLQWGEPLNVCHWGAASPQPPHHPFGTLMVNLYGPWERRRLACPRQGFGTAKPLPYHQSPPFTIEFPTGGSPHWVSATPLQAPLAGGGEAGSHLRASPFWCMYVFWRSKKTYIPYSKGGVREPPIPPASAPASWGSPSPWMGEGLGRG